MDGDIILEVIGVVQGVLFFNFAKFETKEILLKLSFVVGEIIFKL